MKYDYKKLGNLRAPDLRELVTFAYYDSTENLFEGEMYKFLSEEYVRVQAVQCYKRNTSVDSFYEVDERMKNPDAHLCTYQIIMIEPIQYILNNAHDKDELDAIRAIAKNWVYDMWHGGKWEPRFGTKIVFIYDTNIKSVGT
jgi:hypothetical protein